MKYVLLTGGKGVSTERVPKQFVKFFENNESMLKKTYDSVSRACDKSDIYISTLFKYEYEVKNEIKDLRNVIGEPVGIGTFPAILNVAVYLKEIDNCNDDEIVSIIPIDHDTDDNFYKILQDASNRIASCNICLIGVSPTYPATQYGYICHNNGFVTSFKEKPDEVHAAKLFSKGSLWNSGIVVFKLGYIYDIARK